MNFLKKTLFFGIFIGIFLFPVSLQLTQEVSPSHEEGGIRVHYTQRVKYGLEQGHTLSLQLEPAVAFAVDEDNPFGCSTDWGDFDIGCQIMNVFYYIIVVGGNFLVGLSGYILDFFLSHSIQSTSYTNSQFIVKGWEMLRDLTNIIFIVALLFEAFKMVLGGVGAAKKKIMTIVLVALTINFSLYATFFIIDITNILAHTFYNKIEQKSQVYTFDGMEKGETKSVSIAIAKKINPQKIFDEETFDADNRTRGYALLLVVLAINIALISVFIKVSFLFLGRTVGLWIAAVISPLAFSSLMIPKMENLSYIGFNKWLNSLLSMAFMAPVFIFFLYLSIKFMNIGTGGIPQSGASVIDSILPILISAGVIVTLIYLSGKIAKSMSGDFAGIISDKVSGVVGSVVGTVAGTGLAVATGGVGLLGRSVIGGKAAKVMESKKFASFMAKNPRLGKFAYKTLKKTKKSSFDPSKSFLGKQLGKAVKGVGLSIPQQPSWAKIGGSGKGGYDAMREKEKKEAKELKKYLHGFDKEIIEKKEGAQKEKEKLEKEKESIYKEIKETSGKKNKNDEELALMKKMLEEEEARLSELNNKGDLTPEEQKEKERLEKTVESGNSDMAKMSAENEKLEEKLGKMSKKLGQVDAKIDTVNQTIAELENKKLLTEQYGEKIKQTPIARGGKETLVSIGEGVAKGALILGMNAIFPGLGTMGAGVAAMGISKLGKMWKRKRHAKDYDDVNIKKVQETEKKNKEYEEIAKRTAKYMNKDNK